MPFRPLLGSLLSLLVLVSPTAGAQGTGANVNFLTPTGLQTFSVTHLGSDSNFRFGQTGFSEFSIDTNTTSFVWAGRFGLFGRLAVASVGLAHLDINARANLDSPGAAPRQLAAGNEGFGDPRVALRLGLVGTPALDRAAWRAHVPGFQLSGELGVRLPAGDFDSSRLINPGYNRYALDLAFPMVLPLDGRRRTTFLEITPQVVWFGDNTDAPLGGARLAQDPLFITEVQASHHLGGRFWMALGVQYQNGGETAIDGQSRNNALDDWFGEVGVGVVLGRHASLSLGYGRIVSADNGARGEAWRLRLGLLW